MTPVSTPLVEMEDVVKEGVGAPLRIRRLRLAEGDRLAVGGLSPAAAEMMVLLISGAALPDHGAVRIEGQDTRSIATDAQWLAALDRFGIVTRRAVLLEALSVASNLALPLTLAIDPLAPDVLAAVEALSDRVGLARARLSVPASALTPDERLRVHLARALALTPRVLLLEQPMADVSDGRTRAALGAALRAAAGDTGLGWLSLDDDEAFAVASGARRLRLDPETGDLSDTGFWKRLWRSRP